jgi:hypothetical protein
MSDEPVNQKTKEPEEPEQGVRDALLKVLDHERTQAVIDHRRKMKGATLTPYSAKLLANELSKAPNPNDAADTMILRGWRGFKSEWLESKHQGQPPNVTVDAFGNELMEVTLDEVKTVDQFGAKFEER